VAHQIARLTLRKHGYGPHAGRWAVYSYSGDLDLEPDKQWSGSLELLQELTAQGWLLTHYTTPDAEGDESDRVVLFLKRTT
jgi:hypothetical protein